MLQSDHYRIRTQPESQVDGNSSFKSQGLPPRSTPNAVGSIPMYSRGEPGRFVSYSAGGLPASSSNYRTAEERGTGPPIRHRMSLLHPPPQSLEYLIPQIATRPDRPSLQQVPLYGSESNLGKLNPMTESPPCKKLRLGESKPDYNSPLRIDTDRARTGPAYNPQVEAISPTLPSESLRDESPLKSTKEELLQQISRVDREIAKTESQIAKLKKKKVELEEASTQPQRDPEDNSNASDSIIRSLPQSLYADNRKKANEAHHILEKLGPKITLPLYNQPSDTAVYQENKIKYSSFKSTLQRFFKAKLIEKNNREESLAARYSQLSSEFTKKLEKLENYSKRRAKEAKNREIFEKVFPELRKQREDKERFSRVGSRIKSDADLEEIMDGLHEQELEDKKMRSYAVIPPIILDERTRKLRFRNSNGLIDEPMQEYKDKQLINLWTDQEKDIFKEKYLQHPKNFGIIKSYLERKGVADCVQYYYLSKKAQNYRQLLRKNRARTRSSRNQQQNNHSGAPMISSSLPGLPTVVPVVKTEPNGVTTRLQKEQKLDQLPSGNIGSAPEDTPGVSVIEPNNVDELDHPFDEDEIDRCDVIEDQTQNPPSTLQSEYIGQAKKKRKDDHKDNLNQLDTSDEENLELNGDRGGPHNCVVCKVKLDSYLQSRPLVRSQASQYSIVEEDIQPGDRVCSSCRCKAVRRRYKPSQCPIPTCPARRARVKRLRPFPPKWIDLTQETRDAISAKYQIPANVTKCCTACFNRINRRLSPNASLDTPDDPSSDTTSWTEEEIDSMKKALTELGTDWRRLSEEINTKSDLQCRNFYFNFRKKFGLDTLVQEFRKSRGGDGPPILTDEEESGSTTSSCDEGVNHSQDHNRNSVEKKDDYDSSATVSAEEGSAIEPEKAQTIENMKTLPSNPADIPLQLTVRTNNIMNPMQDVLQHSQRQVLHTHHSQNQHSQHHPSNHSEGAPLSHPSHSDHEHQIPVSQHLQNPLSLSNRGSSPHGPHHLHVALHPGGPQHVQPHLMPHSHQQEFISAHSHPSSSIGRYPSPDVNEGHEPMTVKDLMLATIERQLRKNPVPSNQMNHTQISNQGGITPGPSVSPTIQSILKSQDRSHLSQQNQSHILISCSQASQSLGTVPVQQPVISHPSTHFQSHPLYYGSKMDSRTMPTQHVMVRENHPLLQPQSIIPPRDEYETLDLSMKKRTPSPQVSSQRPPSNGPPPAHQPLEFTPRQDIYYSRYPVGRSRQPQQSIMSHPKATKVPPPPPLLTKPTSVSPMKDGSITQGTPLHVSQTMSSKYEGLLRPLKEGSITQGTPVDKLRGKEQTGNVYAYERSPEYYKRMSPAPYSFHSPHPQHYQRPPSSGQRSSPPSGPHPSSYSADQHNASRQIIINDYYTSQQMQQPPPPHMQQQMQNSLAGQSRLDLSKRGLVPVPVSGAPHAVSYMLPPRHEVSYRQSPTPPQSHGQQRQGVIHRVNPHRALIKPESGRYQQHDAFASLVDIAAAQPSLPVPKEDSRPRLGLPRVDVAREGLGKSMAEMERTRLTSSHTHPHGMSTIYRGPPAPVSSHNEPPRSRKEMMEPTRFNRETQDTTLTAASLIDAIITHQINQPSQLDGQPSVPTSRTGDRLFASFQRSVQQPIPQSHFPQLQGHSGQMSGLSHHEEMKMDDIRGMEKSSQGGTWGDHIDFIISKDYASGKGSSSSGHSSGGIQPVSVPMSVPTLTQSSQSKTQEDMGPYISWKLRRALQHEKEQQQLPSHPDERHIIRVVQPEQQTNRAPPKDVNYPFGTGDEQMDSKESAQGFGPPSTSDTQSPSGDHYSNKNKPREGISPLDYVKNRIMEVMRTENSEEKTDEARASPEPNNLNLPAASATSSHQLGSNSNMPASGFGNSGSSGGGTDTRHENSSRQEFQKEEKGEDQSGKSVETDSPTPMVIDESGCDNGALPSNDPAGSSSRNHPSYEPLTDEEN